MKKLWIFILWFFWAVIAAAYLGLVVMGFQDSAPPGSKSLPTGPPAIVSPKK